MRLRRDRIIDRDTLRCIHDTLEWNLCKEKVIVDLVEWEKLLIKFEFAEMSAEFEFAEMSAEFEFAEMSAEFKFAEMSAEFEWGKVLVGVELGKDSMDNRLMTGSDRKRALR